MTRHSVFMLFTLLLAVLTAAPILAKDYENALRGVKSFNAVYDFTHGDPKVANILLTGIDQADDGEAVEALPNEPKVAIVLHDASVNLLTTKKGDHSDAEWSDVQKFQRSLREMKKEGVTLEVCALALDVSPRQHLVRYYGWYSHRARGVRGEGAAIETSSAPSTARSRSWARLLRKIFEVDPLLCPQCNVEMRLVSLIQTPTVIDRILGHLQKIGGNDPHEGTAQRGSPAGCGSADRHRRLRRARDPAVIGVRGELRATAFLPPR